MPAKEQLFRLRPLEWQLHRDDPVEGVWWGVTTVFGSISVQGEPGSPAVWSYCFDEYYDEDRHFCESIEAGKTVAEAFYRGRILEALEPVLE